jgi:hypothetical protein
MTPSQMAANTQIAGTFTQSAYAGAIIPVNSATTGVSTYTSNSDYSPTMIGAGSNQAQFRVVGAGLRVRYTGTELNRGGQYYCLTEPTHDNLNGLSIQNLVSFDECKKLNVSNRDWVTVLFHPTKQTASPDVGEFDANIDDLEFSYDANAGTNITTAGNNYMAIVVQAPSAALSASFDYEAYAVLEYTGQIVRGTTPSHVDPTGFAAVHATASMGGTLPFEGPAERHEETFMEKVESYASAAMTWIGNHVGALGAAAIAML